MNKVYEYYTKKYDEDARLREDCDNRHKVEREVKKRILDAYVDEPGMKVLDIGAGTGLYSIYLAKMGADVTACDIVPEHVDLIQEKAWKEHLDIKCKRADALSLPFESNAYDIVLLAGPMYHLDKDKQLDAIKEAARVCKEDGYVLVDYLAETHGYIQHVLMDKDTLLSGELGKVADPVFTYNSKREMADYLRQAGLFPESFHGTDSITRFLASEINLWDNTHLEKWIDFVDENSNNDNMIDLSEHCVAIGAKWSEWSGRL